MSGNDEVIRYLHFLNRINIIEPLRGAAAAAVVVQHVVYNPIGFIADEEVRSLFHVGEYGVQLFFIISGLVIPLSLISGKYRLSRLGAFLSKRAIRLEPTYLASIALFILYVAARNVIIHDEAINFPSLRDLLLNITYMAPFFNERWILPVYWTLGIELQYYLCIAVIWPLASKVQSSNWLILLVLAGFFGEKLSGDSFLPHWLAFFNVGILLALFLKGNISKKKLIFYEMLTIITIGMSFGMESAIIGMVTIACVICFPDKSGGFIFEWLGRQSYSLYLVHGIVGMSTVNVAMRYFEFETLLQKSVIAMAAFAVSVVFAQVFYVLIEQPTMRMSKRVNLE